MRGSTKNVRVKSGLEKVVEKLMAQYAGSKCPEEYAKENWELVNGVVKAVCEIANAAAIAAEQKDLDSGRSYFAGYRISRKGISGNLARNWSEDMEAAETEVMEARPPPFSGTGHSNKEFCEICK